MKILITCLSTSWGGMEMYTLSTAKELSKLNHQVEVLCVDKSMLYSECIKSGIIIHALCTGGLKAISNLIVLSKLLKQKKYNLIHSHFSKDLWLLVPALRMGNFNTPIYLTKHLASGITKKDIFHRLIYNRVNKAFAISSMIKENLIASTPLNPQKVFLLHNGIDTGRFDPSVVDSKTVRKEFNIGTDEIVVGMMGRFSPGKGHEEFIRAAEIISTKHPNVQFMIVGEASKGEDIYYSSVRELVNSLKLNEKIIFTGFRTDTPEVIAAMDIFIFPSRDESFGLTLVEAMSMSKPTICTNASGVLDIAIDNKTSFFFERENVNQLVEKIEMLINTAELRKQFGVAGRERAIKYFDMSIYIKNLLELYKES